MNINLIRKINDLVTKPYHALYCIRLGITVFKISVMGGLPLDICDWKSYFTSPLESPGKTKF